MKKSTNLFPGYRLSPDGKDYRAFDKAEDVPAGWLRESPESFAKKNGLPLPSAAPVVPPSGDGDATDLDVAGWPWTESLHAATKTKTSAGLWRMKIGVKRPDPKEKFDL